MAGEHRVARIPPRVREFAILAGGALVAYAVARRTVTGGLHLLEAIVALVVAAVVLRWPKLGCVALVVLGASVTSRFYAVAHFGGFRTSIVELLGYLVLAVWAAWRLTGTAGRSTPFFGPFALFVAGALVGTAWGAVNGATRQGLQGDLKPLLLYLLAPAFATFFATGTDQDRLERWLYAIVGLSCVWVLVVAATGHGHPQAGQDLQVVTLGTASTVQRIRPEMLDLLFVCFLLLVARIAVRGITWRRIVLLALFVAAEAFSFTRSSWVPLVLMTGVFLVVRPGPHIPLRGIRVTVVAAVLVVVGYSLASDGLLGPTAHGIAVRATSVFNAHVTDENSYQDRLAEDRAAVRAIERDPVFGVGLARPYGKSDLLYVSNPPHFIPVQRSFLHNTLYAIWLRTGLIGIAAVIYLGIVTVRQARRARRAPPPTDGPRVLAAALAIVGLGIQSLFQTSFNFEPAIIAMAVAVTFATFPEPGHADR